MENFEKKALEKMVLAPYVQKSHCFKGKIPVCGRKPVPACLRTFAILLDYHYMDPVLLKGIHHP